MPAYRRKSFAHVSSALLALVLFACCSQTDTGRHGRTRTASDLVAYTDGIGRSVSLPRHPERIISLAPSVTETLFMVGAGDRVIGVTAECDWPDAARSKPKIGTLLDPNYEMILAARPDLIIATTAGNDKAAVYKLSDLGLAVFVTAPRSVEGIFESTRQIGLITDCQEKAGRLIAGMRARLDDIHRRLAGLPPTRAFFVTWFDPLLAPGRNTFENDILKLVNVVSISSDSEEYYPRFSLEQVLARDPDVILTVFHSGQPLPDLRSISGWRGLRAVKTGRVYVLSETLQHPSPRFVDAVEELAKKLHPEQFQ